MTAPVLIVFTVLVLVAVVGVLLQVSQVARTGGLAPTWEHPTAELEPEPEPEPYRAPRALPRKTGTARGIRPPATPQLTTVQMTPECAEGMHALCPRTGGCECACDHDSKRIVAWNKAEYDRAHEEIPA